MNSITSNTCVLADLLPLAGARVLDIGSGDGNMVRFMAESGASVVGLECGLEQLDEAKSLPAVGDEQYMQGVAQALPFGNGLFDAATFFMSLHHVPEVHMQNTLQEAARVLKPHGILYVAEPLAQGSGYEVHAPIDDETLVRQQALEAMDHASEFGLQQVQELFYDTCYYYANFSEYKNQLIRIDPARAEPFQCLESALRELFERLGRVTNQGVEFDQPMRVNMFRKVSG